MCKMVKLDLSVIIELAPSQDYCDSDRMYENLLYKSVFSPQTLVFCAQLFDWFCLKLFTIIHEKAESLPDQYFLLFGRKYSVEVTITGIGI